MVKPSERENEMKKQFNYSNIHGCTIGAEVKEGDFIKEVTFGGASACTFSDGWTVVRLDDKLGIFWGYKKEFTPFENFASRVIFTIAEEPQTQYVELVGNIYEVYEIQKDKAVLMDINDGTTTECGISYFGTLPIMTKNEKGEWLPND